MSQFQGSNTRVRCTDCSRLEGNTCTAKKATVAPKKRRVCGQYQFRGEYTNRGPVESVYVPAVDKKTRRMINKLLRLGVVPVAGQSHVEVSPEGVPMQTKRIQVPGTTATARLLQLSDNPISTNAQPDLVSEDEVTQDPNAPK